MLDVPGLGFGIGLRTPHYREVLEAAPPGVDWLEVISENFFEPGGNPRRVLREARARFPLVLHGVSLSLGSVDPLDEAYLDRLSALVREIEPALVSDHLCWGSFGGRYAHDLLPLPYTEEALTQVVERVGRVQERLGRRILVENVSSYLTFVHSTIPEWEFLAALAERADCGILLDVNNVYVSAHNHGFDAAAYVAMLPSERVGQIHLAGYSHEPPLLIDTHDGPVSEAVWSLYEAAIVAHGPVPTLVEWDDRIPPLAELAAQARRAAAVCRDALGPPSLEPRLVGHG